MTDSEAAGLLGIALKALMSLPQPAQTHRTKAAAGLVVRQLAILRNQSPEDVQREFEK